jgi:hypothetical protein
MKIIIIKKKNIKIIESNNENNIENINENIDNNFLLINFKIDEDNQNIYFNGFMYRFNNNEYFESLTQEVRILILQKKYNEGNKNNNRLKIKKMFDNIIEKNKNSNNNNLNNNLNNNNLNNNNLNKEINKEEKRKFEELIENMYVFLKKFYIMKL